MYEWPNHHFVLSGVCIHKLFNIPGLEFRFCNNRSVGIISSKWRTTQRMKEERAKRLGMSECPWERLCQSAPFWPGHAQPSGGHVNTTPSHSPVSLTSHLANSNLSNPQSHPQTLNILTRCCEKPERTKRIVTSRHGFVHLYIPGADVREVGCLMDTISPVQTRVDGIRRPFLSNM